MAKNRRKKHSDNPVRRATNEINNARRQASRGRNRNSIRAYERALNALRSVRDVGAVEIQVTALEGLGDMHLILGEPAHARTRFREAISMGGNIPSLRLGLAECGINDDPAGVLEELATIESDIDDGMRSRFHWVRARARRGVGDMKGALDDVGLSSGVGGTDMAIFTAEVQSELGLHGEAIWEYHKILKSLDDDMSLTYDERTLQWFTLLDRIATIHVDAGEQHSALQASEDILDDSQDTERHVLDDLPVGFLDGNLARLTMLRMESGEVRDGVEALLDGRDRVFHDDEGECEITSLVRVWADRADAAVTRRVLATLDNEDALFDLINELELSSYIAARDRGDARTQGSILVTRVHAILEDARGMVGHQGRDGLIPPLLHEWGFSPHVVFAMPFADLLGDMLDLDLEREGTLLDTYSSEMGDVLDDLSLRIMEALRASRPTILRVEDTGFRGTLILTDELDGGRFTMDNGVFPGRVEIGKRLFIRPMTLDGVHIPVSYLFQINVREGPADSYRSYMERMGLPDSNILRVRWLMSREASLAGPHMLRPGFDPSML